MEDFDGCKIALLYGDSLVTIQRDDKPSIRWANMWEIPGGGRENDESPEECSAREIHEELNLEIPKGAFIWKREWPAMRDTNLKAWFLVATISEEDIKKIKLGDEGQGWQMMPIDEFISREDVIPQLKTRLQDYLDNGR